MRGWEEEIIILGNLLSPHGMKLCRDVSKLELNMKISQ